MSNGKKSGDRGKIKNNSWRGNEFGWKQNLEKMERRTIGRDETSRTGRRIWEKVERDIVEKICRGGRITKTAPGERWYGIIDGTLEKEYDEWEQNEDNREKVRVKGREGCSSG